MWLEHTQRVGWKAVAAVEARPPIDGPTGVHDLELAGAPARRRLRLLRRTGSVVATAGGRRACTGVGADATQIADLMTSYFELTELHIAPARPGPRTRRGTGPHGCSPAAAKRTCCCRTPEINGEANRAWRLYRRLGFTDIIRGYHFAGDPRAFAILGPVRLPLELRPLVWHDDQVPRPPAPATACFRPWCCCC